MLWSISWAGLNCTELRLATLALSVLKEKGFSLTLLFPIPIMKELPKDHSHQIHCLPPRFSVPHSSWSVALFASIATRLPKVTSILLVARPTDTSQYSTDLTFLQLLTLLLLTTPSSLKYFVLLVSLLTETCNHLTFFLPHLWPTLTTLS